MRKKLLPMSVSFAVLAIVVAGQQAEAEESGESHLQRPINLEEVVVTARRRSESLQSVPIFVNVATGEDLEKLNILRFSDLETIVPGLTLNDSGDNTASIRGVRFDSLSSGNNATVEFYLNDAHISGLGLLRSMFDVEQVEVLRGPQGTLRGRASPSGSITVTTRRPDLNQAGGHINTTLNDIGGTNVQGALNIPIIDGKLAVRFAALYDATDDSRVKSVCSSADPYRDTKGRRITIAAEPHESFSLLASYTRLLQDSRSYMHVESANIAHPAQGQGTVPLSASDRRSVQGVPTLGEDELDQFNVQFEYRFGGHQINYVGAHHRMRNDAFGGIVGVGDAGAFFGPEYSQIPENFGQYMMTDQKQYSHEVRLSSSEPLFGGKVDYVLGGFYNRVTPNTDLERETLIFMTHLSGMALTPDTPTMLLFTPTMRRAETVEKSVFGNLHFHLSDATELSVGARYIEFSNEGSLIVPALGGELPAAAVDEDLDEVIYQVTLSHRFSSSLMGYASYGTSWRPSNPVVGNFSIAQSPLEQQFLNPPPEESKSFELGIKSNWLDNRVMFNATAFWQEFDNYPYRAADIFHVYTDPGPVQSVRRFGFVGAVPVDVYGVELEAAFQATDHWNISGVFSWAKGEVDDGLIPCNDYYPHDGAPDTSGLFPTSPQDILAVSGGENLVGCNVNFRSTDAPLWSASLQSEYFYPFGGGFEGYLRGQVSLYGSSKGDPANAYDSVDRYQIVNVFAGIRDVNRGWDVSIYARNLANTERVLTRAGSPLTTAYRTSVPSAEHVGVSSYRQVSMTPEREIGVSLRWAFGSR